MRYGLTDMQPQPNSQSGDVRWSNECDVCTIVDMKQKHEYVLPYSVIQFTLTAMWFQHRQAPTYATDPKWLNLVRLESSSTGSSFPANTPKPVPKITCHPCPRLEFAIKKPALQLGNNISRLYLINTFIAYCTQIHHRRQQSSSTTGAYSLFVCIYIPLAWTL